MANIFKRLFRIGSAEAHSAVDKLEDPIKMTEQGIRDMKVELQKSLEGLAELKALVIRYRNESQSEQDKAGDYEQKALLLLKKAEANELEPQEAERLATEALKKKEHHTKQEGFAIQAMHKYEGAAATLEKTIQTLKTTISSWESELRTLQARVKVSSAQKNINKHLANIDASSTIEMLERMRDKVNKEEALAESYGQIANESKSVDQEINDVLKDIPSESVQSDLERLKAQLKNKAE